MGDERGKKGGLSIDAAALDWSKQQCAHDRGPNYDNENIEELDKVIEEKIKSDPTRMETLRRAYLKEAFGIGNRSKRER